MSERGFDDVVAGWAGLLRAGLTAATPALRQVLPEAAAVLTPGGALEALLRTVGGRLAGRRITLPRAGVALLLESLDLRPDPVGVAVGQLDDVRVVARDLSWRGIACERVEVLFRNVHLRPLPAPTLVAAPVEAALHLAPAVVAEQVAAVRPGVALEVGPDHAVLARAARFPRLGAVVLEPGVGAGALLLRPVALRRGRLRLPLPARLRPVRVEVPPLPRDLRLRAVTVEPAAVVLHLVADEWREPVPAARLADATRWLDLL